jgi:ATP-dependent DNA helicase RecG
VVYGTRRLLERPPELRRCGLVVVEQNGNYGLPDLSKLVDKAGARPDLLVTTPTPVPALLAMTVYGQLAMTVVKSPPMHGVETVVTSSAERAAAYAAAREAIAEKHQVILVFPSELSPSEARRLTQVLGDPEGGALPGARFSIFSEGLTPQERFRAYDDFQHRRSDVLFATAAFEDGPIVPNAAVMVVEYADTIGLVRLHRLRNHIANGWIKSRCFLVQSEESSAEGLAVLDMVARETDGFRIADLDLARRGVDAVLGPEAADVPRFVWADPAQDRETLVRARQEAFRLLANDPGLRRRSNRPLLNLVRARFGEEPLLGDAPMPSAQQEAGGQRRRRRRRR